VGIGQRLSGERQRERDGYRLELVRLRQEAARLDEKREQDAPAVPTRTVCAARAETLVLAAYRASPAPLLKDGRLDGARFAALSDQAVRAERFAEESHEPPALPHRMGGAQAPPACFPMAVIASKPPSKAPAPAKNTRARGR